MSDEANYSIPLPGMGGTLSTSPPVAPNRHFPQQDPNHGTYSAIDGFFKDRSQATYTVLSGSNNSGKTFILKGVFSQSRGQAFLVGAQRFTVLPSGRNQMHPPGPPTHPIGPDVFGGDNVDFLSQQFSDVLASMKNVERSRLTELSTQLLGVEVRHDYIDSENEYAGKQFVIDGELGNKASTGSRLFLFLIACCLNSRFPILLIDEPELGLAPALQHKLKRLLIDPSLRAEYCPHLRQVFVSTHSHIFLDRDDITNNFVVTKTPPTVTLTQIRTLQGFQELQFRLLGNTLDSFFLPEAIVIVEGDTDLKFIKRAVNAKFPDKRVLVIGAEGDLKRQVRAFDRLMGGLRATPFASRVFAVFDKVRNKDQVEEIIKTGVPASQVITWAKNGIEYYYPVDVLSKIFNTKITDLNQISITGDRIDASTGVVKTKNELCDLVCALAGDETEYPEEFRIKLLDPLTKVLS